MIHLGFHAPDVALAVVFAASALYFLRTFIRERSLLPLPPGPKPLPFIGNLLDMPKHKPWLTFGKWCDMYGDVIFLKLPKQSIVVLGTVEAATELMDKRSGIYSDKSTAEMMKMMSWDWAMALMPYGQEWRALRRITHQYFSPDAVKEYQSIQLSEVRAGLQRVLTSPELACEHIHQSIISVITRVVYGLRMKSLDDEYITLAETATKGLGLGMIPGAYWVEYMPFLKFIPSWVPGAKGSQLADEYRPFVEAMRDVPFDHVKQQLNCGEAVPCMVSSLITQLQEECKTTDQASKQDKIARDAAGVVYAAAADTTSSSTEVCILAMALFPEVQQRVHEELDDKIGGNRLADFSDLDALVYVRAVVLEVLRWIPVAPVGATHRVMEDDIYKGFRIPKGSIVMGNGWSMLHNPVDYPEPDLFRPERFIKDGKINPEVRDPTTISFGFGRRICPGRHLAFSSLMMFVASLLHAFDIGPGVDENGEPLKLSTEANEGILMIKTVPRMFTPRSAHIARVIQESASE